MPPSREEKMVYAMFTRHTHTRSVTGQRSCRVGGASPTPNNRSPLDNRRSYAAMFTSITMDRLLRRVEHEEGGSRAKKTRNRDERQKNHRRACPYAHIQNKAAREQRDGDE